jgi:hypothetical protein
VTPDLEDNLPRLADDPPGWHVRETVDDGYPLMGSSPAERLAFVEDIARIEGQAMRDHTFEGGGRYCDARITTRPLGSPETGRITGWVGCGYPADKHPLVDA